jgi:putative transposase
MARPLRVEYPGALYHVTSRGNARQNIFRYDRDRLYFLSLLEKLIERFNWRCHGYCLMNNHYHLIVETPQGNLSRGMRQLNGIYTQKYNWRYKKTGHVFQGRYKAIIVDKESYLLELSRYVVLNPVRAHVTEKPEDWKWSSYQATAGLDTPPEFLTTEWLLSQFGDRKKRAEDRYRKFVIEGIAGGSPWKELNGQIYLGDKEFIRQIKTAPTSRPGEIPKSQYHADRLSLAELFGEVGQLAKAERDSRIHTAHIQYGYTFAQIGGHLNIHYATASRAVKRITKDGQEKV